MGDVISTARLAPTVALLARRQELARAIARREEIAIEQYADPIDNIWRTVAREAGAATLDTLARELEAVEAALKRIADGTYGICMDCEEPIAPRRLEVVPHAARCVRCQDMAEQENRNGE